MRGPLSVDKVDQTLESLDGIEGQAADVGIA